MFDGPQSTGTKLIWLVNWMWRDPSVIPGGQQVQEERAYGIRNKNYKILRFSIEFQGTLVQISSPKLRFCKKFKVQVKRTS